MIEKYAPIIDHACGLLAASPNASNGRARYRSKADHTRRACAWAIRIGSREGADMDAVIAACAFHDVGYVNGAQGHAETGADIAEVFFKKAGCSRAFIDKVCGIVLCHGDRSLLVPSTDIDTLSVIEADNIDEKGPMALLRDAMAEGIEFEQSYQKTYERIVSHHLRGDANICVTQTGRMYWDERQQAVKRFLAVLERDLYFGGEHDDYADANIMIKDSAVHAAQL